MDPPITEQAIINTQKWLEGVWHAVRVAHIAYRDTGDAADYPDIETGNDPDMADKFVDASIEAIESHVHVPPRNPRTSDMDEDACALWLAAQEAILSMTRLSTSVDSCEIRSRLSALAHAIKRCENEDGQCWVDRDAHYHSTRILLSLIALFAPAFAEASWRAVHYGHEQWRLRHSKTKDEGEDYGSVPFSGLGNPEELRELGFQDLASQWDPNTLSSIFSQPFPVPESSEVIDSLRVRSTGSELAQVGTWREGIIEAESWWKSCSNLNSVV